MKNQNLKKILLLLSHNVLKNIIFASFLTYIPYTVIHAEPWLTNRFSQNCAGCHAPGRINKKPKDRRCSLSCQGCHVNPNGGGLRSQYGKWNEDHWLRSVDFKFLKQKKLFKPVSQQHYGRKKTKQRHKKGGFPLVKTNKKILSEWNFTREDGLENITAKNFKEFMRQVPKGDPLRERFSTKVDAGGDFRIQYNSFFKNDDMPKRDSQFFLMSADIGVRARPFYKNLNFVLEHRSVGIPNSGQNVEELTSNNASFMRSAYIMVDDLPYNSFIMAGAYKPLFGYGVPDHTALSQSLLSRALGGGSGYRQKFEAVTIGLAPNVPYGNFHYFRKNLSSGDGDWTGFGANLGLKFVSFGAGVNYSIISATHEAATKTDILAQSLVLGGMVSPKIMNRKYPITSNLEFLLINRKSEVEEQNNLTMTLDTYLNFWRQFYLNLQYANSNSTINLDNGSASQLRVGVKSFLASGVAWSLHIGKDSIKNDADSTELSQSYLQSQLHLYF